MRIAVAGATGRVGRHVVEVLEAGGHDVVPISRSGGVDVITGEGLAAALTGVQSIIDASTGPSPEQQAATDFFTTAARNLQEAGHGAGVRQLVVVSIIGVDQFSGGYGVAKVAHERAALAGPVPARILRAAQFHEFGGVLMEWGRQGDVIYLPPMRTQSVAARTVAEALANLATAPPPEPAERSQSLPETGPRAGAGASSARPFPEIAGPRAESLADLAQLLAARRGDSVKIEIVSNPADPDHDLYLSDAYLPGPDATLAGPTFAEWLETTS